MHWRNINWWNTRIILPTFLGTIVIYCNFASTDDQRVGAAGAITKFMTPDILNRDATSRIKHKFLENELIFYWFLVYIIKASLSEECSLYLDICYLFDLADLNSKPYLDLCQNLFIFSSWYEWNYQSCCFEAAGSSWSVKICIRGTWHIKMNCQIDTFKINSALKDVCTYYHTHILLFKLSVKIFSCSRRHSSHERATFYAVLC